ncbi:hypothetical protein ACQ859_19130 [Roseateles chitinivorans]|uniref:hypothetical protein n=1 Tax=Roseateles chitinivorans TaxID=2917965 RepID=UPI003D66DD62
MHLHKLAWAMPLMLAATVAHADSSGSFLEGARLATLVRPEAAAPANGPAHQTPAGVRPASQGQTPTSTPATSPGPSSVIDTDIEPSGASFEIRNFLTLVVALALVGWVQRRRRDA